MLNKGVIQSIFFLLIFIVFGCDVVIDSDLSTKISANHWVLKKIKLSNVENSEVEFNSIELINNSTYKSIYTFNSDGSYSSEELGLEMFNDKGDWIYNSKLNSLIIDNDTLLLVEINDSVMILEYSQSETDLWLEDEYDQYPEYKGARLQMVLFAERLIWKYGSFTDPRDGYTYKTIEINGKTWLAENLRYNLSSNIARYYSSWFPDSLLNVQKVGFHYTYNGAINACPVGWHLPSENDWIEMFKYGGAGEQILGKTGDWYYWEDIGHKFKAETGWEDPNYKDDNGNWYTYYGNGTNEFGFTALPAGNANNVKNFTNFKNIASFWSTCYENIHRTNMIYPVVRFSINNTDQNWVILNQYSFIKFEGKYGYNRNYYSVRCIKDAD